MPNFMGMPQLTDLLPSKVQSAVPNFLQGRGAKGDILSHLGMAQQHPESLQIQQQGAGDKGQMMQALKQQQGMRKIGFGSMGQQ